MMLRARDKLTRHWTETSTDDFLYRIGADFAQQIEVVMQSPQTSQAALAKTLGVTEGRVSQVLNNPGNLTLRNVIEYARALKRKAAIVVYDDDDPLNQNGPINSAIFAKCWELTGRPSDFFELEECMLKVSATSGADAVPLSPAGPDRYIYGLQGANETFRVIESTPVSGTSTSTENYDQRDFLWQSLSR